MRKKAKEDKNSYVVEVFRSRLAKGSKSSVRPTSSSVLFFLFRITKKDKGLIYQIKFFLRKLKFFLNK